MKQKYSITLMVIGVLLIIVATIAVTKAAFTTGGTQSEANIFESECISIELESSSNAITLNKQAPITDFEGLELEGYTFTVKNTCKTPINYLVNLESLNSTSNTLNADYIKVAINSDTMDNIVSILSSNETSSPLIENAYASHNLYTGKLLGNTSKTFNLKLWLDYDTTVEQGASKTYTSKISVLAKSQNETIIEAPNIKTTIENANLVGTITGDSTQATYCESAAGVCTPTTPTTITNNTISIPITKDQDKTVCIKLDNNKATCVNIEAPKPISIPDIIASIEARTDDSYKKDTAPDFTEVATGAETAANNGIYKVSDGMYNGSSYYWRGAATTNHVIFDSKCWRIVRINGDGSIRLIYNGTPTNNTCPGNGANASSVVLSRTAYNSSWDNSSYVGWTYTASSQRPNNTNPQTGGDSAPIKTALESWYSTNITDKSKVVKGKFCNDRNTKNNETWRATGSTQYYAAYARLIENKTPTLACPNGDVYSLDVGMITADEVTFAGASGTTNNTSYYLYNGQYYWTMSPYQWYSGNARVFYVRGVDGYLNYGYVSNTGFGVRPVINLSADTLFNQTGNGTTELPYVVQ